MTERTARALVDAYGCAVDLLNEQVPKSASEKIDELHETLREFLISQLSEREGDSE